MSRRRKRHWDKEKQNNKQVESQNSKPTEEVIKEKKVRIPVAKDVTNRCSAVFNQFICVECYRTNAIIENKSKVTPLYKEKNTKKEAIGFAIGCIAIIIIGIF